jgi:hypothetical protein
MGPQELRPARPVLPRRRVDPLALEDLPYSRRRYRDAESGQLSMNAAVPMPRSSCCAISPKQRHRTRDDQEDQLRAHKPKTISPADRLLARQGPSQTFQYTGGKWLWGLTPQDAAQWTQGGTAAQIVSRLQTAGYCS